MATRRVRFRAEFVDDLAANSRWLARQVSLDDLDRLEATIAALVRRIGTFPGIGVEVARRGTISYREFGLGRLPYVVFYFYDDSRPSEPV